MRKQAFTRVTSPFFFGRNVYEKPFVSISISTFKRFRGIHPHKSFTPRVM